MGLVSSGSEQNFSFEFQLLLFLFFLQIERREIFTHLKFERKCVLNNIYRLNWLVRILAALAGCVYIWKGSCLEVSFIMFNYRNAGGWSYQMSEPLIVIFYWKINICFRIHNPTLVKPTYASHWFYFLILSPPPEGNEL